MRILVLTPYPKTGASPRHRIYAFQDGLLQNGIELKVSPFLTDEIFQRRIKKGNKDIKVLLGIFFGFAKRIFEVLTLRQRYDAVYIHRQAFPLMHKFFDGFIIRTGVPIIFDMDDAVFTEYPIDQFLQSAAGVTVGNAYLAKYVNLISPDVPVQIIPTTVDLRHYTASPLKSFSDHRHSIVGWIGTASTFHRYLAPVLPQLINVTKKHNAEFHVIASPDIKKDVEKVGAVFIEWSMKDEVHHLQKFDIGLMPLHDDEFVRGKCAFKLIQYSAVGIPGIGTDIGANREVIVDKISGYLTATPREMCQRLDELLSSPGLRLEMGMAARQVIEARYSLQSQIPVLAKVLRLAEYQTRFPEVTGK